mmetsp:Transcript_2550/g.4091  ORF Transcript_2550/g.4091 Transcript_2550/m.4091 type:complete len:83 (-) Transcript_2550:1340-1588(-)
MLAARRILSLQRISPGRRVVAFEQHYQCRCILSAAVQKRVEALVVKHDGIMARLSEEGNTYIIIGEGAVCLGPRTRNIIVIE